MNRADAFLLLYLAHCVASSDSQLTYKCTRYDSHFYMYIKSTKNVTSEIENEIKKLIENFERSVNPNCKGIDGILIRHGIVVFQIEQKEFESMEKWRGRNEHGMCSTSLVSRDYSGSTT